MDNDKVGNVSFNDTRGDHQFNKPYSEKTSELIDQEVRKQISEVYEMTKKLLIDKRRRPDKIGGQKLLEKKSCSSRTLRKYWVHVRLKTVQLMMSL